MKKETLIIAILVALIILWITETLGMAKTSRILGGAIDVGFALLRQKTNTKSRRNKGFCGFYLLRFKFKTERRGRHSDIGLIDFWSVEGAGVRWTPLRQQKHRPKRQVRPPLPTKNIIQVFICPVGNAVLGVPNKRVVGDADPYEKTLRFNCSPQGRGLLLPNKRCEQAHTLRCILPH